MSDLIRNPNCFLILKAHIISEPSWNGQWQLLKGKNDYDGDMYNGRTYSVNYMYQFYNTNSVNSGNICENSIFAKIREFDAWRIQGFR